MRRENLTASRYDMVVMVSGGIDSTVLLYDLVCNKKANPLALHFLNLTSSYEYSYVEKNVNNLRVDIETIDYSHFLNVCVPPRSIPRRTDGRIVFGNTVVLSMALAFTIARSIPELYVGLNKVDSESYIENTPVFMDYLRHGLKIVESDCSLCTPYHNLSKSQIIKKGIDIGIDFNTTLSCINPINERQCNKCDSCRDRKTAFRELGVEDPKLT